MPAYNKNDPETIQHMFGSIAKQYDRTNAILSFQMHRLWNKKLVKHVYEVNSPQTLLDLCCGTGEIAFAYLNATQTPCEAYLLDFCPEMLECAKRKVKPSNNHQINFIHADAQEIPLPPESVQCVTVAYGIRNVKSPQKCLQEVYCVLKPGGTFGVLELTQPTNSLLRSGHAFYLKYILPLLGRFLTSNQEAYEYLCQSIHTFIKPQELEKVFHDCGFEKTQVIPLMGGIATLILGKKPH